MPVGVACPAGCNRIAIAETGRLGAMQGDQISVELNSVQFTWKAMGSVINDLIIASGAFGLIILLDIMVTGTGEENP